MPMDCPSLCMVSMAGKCLNGRVLETWLFSNKPSPCLLNFFSINNYFFFRTSFNFWKLSWHRKFIGPIEASCGNSLIFIECQTSFQISIAASQSARYQSTLKNSCKNIWSVLSSVPGNANLMGGRWQNSHFRMICLDNQTLFFSKQPSEFLTSRSGSPIFQW